MTPSIFEERLVDRARAAGVAIDSRLFSPLHGFYSMLVRWNKRMNLTALPLEELEGATVDRLFIEPLAAAPLLLDLPVPAWFDIGSGSGSPAIPLALARPDLRLTMVESKARKAAFLREAVRQIGVRAVVADQRFAEVAALQEHTAGLVTIRGVRIDQAVARDIDRISQPGALVALFASAGDRATTFPLGPSITHRLTDTAALLCQRVSRGTTR